MMDRSFLRLWTAQQDPPPPPLMTWITLETSNLWSQNLISWHLEEQRSQNFPLFLAVIIRTNQWPHPHPHPAHRSPTHKQPATIKNIYFPAHWTVRAPVWITVAVVMSHSWRSSTASPDFPHFYPHHYFPRFPVAPSCPCFSFQI